MKKKSIFQASFEESLNLEDDGFVQYQKKDVYGKLEKYYKRGHPSIGLKIQSVILALIFPISLNFMLLVISIYLHDSNPKDLAVSISKTPLLSAEIYVLFLFVWLLIVLVGKFIKRNYLLPYRYHFHILTFIIWFVIQFNLLAIDLALSSLSMFGVLILFIFLTFLTYRMIISQIRNLKFRLYGDISSPTSQDKIAGVISKYGIAFLGIGVIISFILKKLPITLSFTMQGLGLLLTWIILDIAVVAMLIYIEFPSYLQAFYKWKYPKEYREWEGQSLAEWYGKAYLKKHPELLEKDSGEN